MHQQRGLGCDDAFSYGIVGDFVVAAVADGAGSVSGTSAWGAHVACQSVLDDAMRPAFVEQYRTGSPEDGEDLVRNLFGHALRRVHHQAVAMGLDVSLLSTTLTVAVADGDSAVFGQVGDGIVAVESDGTIRTVLVERKDEYANTTSFIQSDGALEEALRTVTLRDVTAFALSTDGMSYKITNVATGEAYEPFFRGCWQHLRGGARTDRFAALLEGIEDDQTGDDKTMVLATLRDLGDGAAPTLTADASPPPRIDTGFEPSTVPLSTPLSTQAPPGPRRRRWGRRQRI